MQQLDGTENGEFLNGLSGDHVIYALGGDDRILVRPGNNYVDGGLGFDVLTVLLLSGAVNTVIVCDDQITFTADERTTVTEFHNIEQLSFSLQGDQGGALLDLSDATTISSDVYFGYNYHVIGNTNDETFVLADGGGVYFETSYLGNLLVYAAAGDTGYISYQDGETLIIEGNSGTIYRLTGEIFLGFSANRSGFLDLSMLDFRVGIQTSYAGDNITGTRFDDRVFIGGYAQLGDFTDYVNGNGGADFYTLEFTGPLIDEDPRHPSDPWDFGGSQYLLHHRAVITDFGLDDTLSVRTLNPLVRVTNFIEGNGPQFSIRSDYGDNAIWFDYDGDTIIDGIVVLPAGGIELRTEFDAATGVYTNLLTWNRMFTGNNDDDFISGTDGDDVISALGGDDYISQRGADVIDGGDGYDTVALNDPSYQPSAVMTITDGGLFSDGAQLASWSAIEAVETDLYLNTQYVDASAFSGNLFFNQITGNGPRITGGSGDDVLTIGFGGVSHFDGGGGFDIIKVNAEFANVMSISTGPDGELLSVYDDLFSSLTEMHTRFANVERLELTAAYLHLLDASGATTDVVAFADSYRPSSLHSGAGNDVLIDGDYMVGGDGEDIFAYAFSFLRFAPVIGHIGDMTADDSIFGFASGNSETASFTTTHRNGRTILRFGEDQLVLHNGYFEVAPDSEGMFRVTHVLAAIPEGATGSTDMLLGTASSDTLSGRGGDDVLTGGGGGDTLVGGRGDDVLLGQDGDDVLAGEEGDDRLIGGNGADRLFGGVGQDELYGDAGDDLLFGYAGEDLLIGGDGGDRLFGGAEDDQLYGGADDDRLFGDDGLDRLYGADGDDRLNGGNGVDFLDGGNGNDRLYGGNDEDILFGGSGADRLDGGNGSDRLFGEAGDDRLIGGAGADQLTGGDGADRFVFAAGDSGNDFWSADVITDFSADDGDVIDLRQIDARALTPGDDAFTFIGESAFSGTAGELRIERIEAFLSSLDIGMDSLPGPAFALSGDIDGDGAGDFLIYGLGVVQIDAGQFML